MESWYLVSTKTRSFSTSVWTLSLDKLIFHFKENSWRIKARLFDSAIECDYFAREIVIVYTIFVLEFIFLQVPLDPERSEKNNVPLVIISPYIKFDPLIYLRVNLP